VSSDFGPLYQEGTVTLDTPDLFQRLDLDNCQFGVQVAEDGRVWVCINSVSVLRFKPKVITTVMVDDRHAEMLDKLPYVPFDQFSTDD
jgi:hypothetical protein